MFGGLKKKFKGFFEKEDQILEEKLAVEFGYQIFDAKGDGPCRIRISDGAVPG